MQRPEQCKRLTDFRHSAIALCVMVLCALAPLPLPGTGIYAADSDDDTPPTLHGVAVSAASLFPGESITVSADARDEGSGVRTVTVRFRNVATGDILAARLLPNSDEDADLPYSGRLKLPQGTSPGVYRVSGVSLEDWEGNRSRYTPGGDRPLEGETTASFTVLDGGSEGLPKPVSCTAQAEGSGVDIRFRAAGDRINRVVLLFENSESNRKLSFTLEQEDCRDGVFTRRFNLPPEEPAGAFALRQVSIRDTAGNKTVYTSRTGGDDPPLNLYTTFAVRGGQGPAAPVLHAVSAGEPARSGGAFDVPLRLEVGHSGPGIDHITVRFRHESSGETASKVLRAADSRDGLAFAGRLTLDEDAPRGLYLLDSVTVADCSGGRSTYCRPADASDRKLPLPQVPSFALNF